ncbi:hypothetical protein FKM82_015357 [Ascaphus truei]
MYSISLPCQYCMLPVLGPHRHWWKQFAPSLIGRGGSPVANHCRSDESGMTTEKGYANSLFQCAITGICKCTRKRIKNDIQTVLVIQSFTLQ